MTTIYKWASGWNSPELPGRIFAKKEDLEDALPRDGRGKGKGMAGGGRAGRNKGPCGKEGEEKGPGYGKGMGRGKGKGRLDINPKDED